MDGITAYDFTSSEAYREIFGLDLEQGQKKAAKPKPPALTHRQLQQRCGTLSSAQQTPIPILPPQRQKPWPTPCPNVRGRKTSLPC